MVGGLEVENATLHGDVQAARTCSTAAGGFMLSDGVVSGKFTRIQNPIQVVSLRCRMVVVIYLAPQIAVGQAKLNVQFPSVGFISSFPAAESSHCLGIPCSPFAAPADAAAPSVRAPLFSFCIA